MEDRPGLAKDWDPQTGWDPRRQRTEGPPSSSGVAGGVAGSVAGLAGASVRERGVSHRASSESHRSPVTSGREVSRGQSLPSVNTSLSV